MGNRVLSGIQPTGALHLGRYLGAVRNWVRLQDRYPECFYCVVDYHALTSEPDPKELRGLSLSVARELLACGVDPQRSCLFIQSQVPEHAELCWIFQCIASYGWLTRMTQFKEKGERAEHVNAGLFAYPVLMAADILIYKATHVPVGDDQLQHLELCREIGRRFNQLYGPTFPAETEAILSEAPRIMSFRDPTKKMSASLGPEHHLPVTLDEATVRREIQRAVTDVGAAGEGMSPGVANLIGILKAIAGPERTRPLEEDHAAGRLKYKDLKQAVADAVVAELRPIRERLSAIAPERVVEVLRAGAARARAEARKTLDEVREKVGLQGL